MDATGTNLIKGKNTMKLELNENEKRKGDFGNIQFKIKPGYESMKQSIDYSQDE